MELGKLMTAFLKIDKTDVEILKALLVESRTKMKSIAKECETSSSTIKNRLDRMKEVGLFIKTALSLNLNYFDYPIPLLIGVIINPEHESDIIEFIESKVMVAGIDKTVGKYDLCFFVFAKDINELDRLKYQIREQEGVRSIELFIWTKFHFNFGNIDYLQNVDV